MKGFTLVEILAIVVLLGILGILAFSGVDKILDENKNKAYDIQINNIIDSAKTWAGENVFKLPSNEDEFIIVTLGELKQSGYVKNDIINPVTKESFSNNLQIKITVKDNSYDYSIIEEY